MADTGQVIPYLMCCADGSAHCADDVQRRREQIKITQRAYRERKEATISGLIQRVLLRACGKPLQKSARSLRIPRHLSSPSIAGLKIHVSWTSWSMTAPPLPYTTTRAKDRRCLTLTARAPKELRSSQDQAEAISISYKFVLARLLHH